MGLKDQAWATSFGSRIEIRTVSGELVAVVQDTMTAIHIVEAHNAQINMIENSIGYVDLYNVFKEDSLQT